MNRFNKKRSGAHGYWEHKHLPNVNGKLWYKCAFNNGILFGYGEWYLENGKIECKRINI